MKGLRRAPPSAEMTPLLLCTPGDVTRCPVGGVSQQILGNGICHARSAACAHMIVSNIQRLRSAWCLEGGQRDAADHRQQNIRIYSSGSRFILSAGRLNIHEALKSRNRASVGLMEDLPASF